MTSLFVDRKNVEMTVDGEALVFYENGNRSGTVPIAALERVFVMSGATISTASLAKLGKAGVGMVIMYGHKHEPVYFMPRDHNDALRRVRQCLLTTNGEFRLQVARELIRTKIRGQLTNLTTLREERPGLDSEFFRCIGIVKTCLESVVDCGSIESVRGEEGAAAAAYFRAISMCTPPSIGFAGRNKRPPRDPLNAVLSLGYTVLTSEVSLALHKVGLDPMIGYFHELDFGRHSLACDMVEPMRPYFDRFALELFAEQELRSDDFSVTDAGCSINKAARMRFYQLYEDKAKEWRKKIDKLVDCLLDMIESHASEGQGGT